MAAAGAWFLQVMQDEEEEIKEKQKFRNSYARSNYKMCYWYLMLQNPYIADPTTREGKQFRRRFAVPYEIFVHLVEKCKAWFDPATHDKYGRECIPIELKVLGSLRVLSKG